MENNNQPPAPKPQSLANKKAPKEETFYYHKDRLCGGKPLFLKPKFPQYYIFAPTACQLMPIIKQMVFEVNIAVGGLFWNETEGYSFNHLPQIPPDTNQAQYLSKVLLFLIKNK
jgi:hypothetical protein